MATSAFKLFINDILKGGIGHKISFTRVGHFVIAKMNSYKRVYKPNVLYHYLKQPKKIAQQKGHLIWKNLEVSSSRKDT